MSGIGQRANGVIVIRALIYIALIQLVTLGGWARMGLARPRPLCHSRQISRGKFETIHATPPRRYRRFSFAANDNHSIGNSSHKRPQHHLHTNNKRLGNFRNHQNRKMEDDGLHIRILSRQIEEGTKMKASKKM